MTDRSKFTQQVFSSRIPISATLYVGEIGRIFWHEDTGELRISDGVTPHGRPIYFANSSGGTDLKLYDENSTPALSPLANHPISIALGDGSLATAHGAIVQAAGVFNHQGDAQVGSYVARGVTASGGWAEVFLNGLTDRLLISANTSMAFTATIIARREAASNEGAVYEIRGGIDRGTTTISTRLIGTPSKTVVSEDNPTWDCSVTADGTHGALALMVKGETSKTIRWVVHIQTVEVRA